MTPSILSKDEFTRLTTGYMGNYELLGWKDRRGLTHTATTLLVDVSKVAEVFKPWADRPLTNDQQLLLKQFKKMSPDNQKRLMAIVETFINE